MTSILDLRHKFEFWKQQFQFKKTPENRLKMQISLKEYMDFIDKNNVSKENLESDRYLHCPYLTTENPQYAPTLPSLKDTFVPEKNKKEEKGVREKVWDKRKKFIHRKGYVKTDASLPLTHQKESLQKKE